MTNRNGKPRPILKRPDRKRGKGSYGQFVTSSRPSPGAGAGNEPGFDDASGAGSSRRDATPSSSTPYSQAVVSPTPSAPHSSDAVSARSTEDSTPAASVEEALRSELEQARLREEQLVVSVNKYKQELAALQVIVRDEQDSHKLAISAVGQLKAEVASLKQEKDGLKKLLDDLKSS